MANTSRQDSILGPPLFWMTPPEYHFSAYLRATGALTPGNSILREGLDWGIVQLLDSSSF